MMSERRILSLLRPRFRRGLSHNVLVNRLGRHAVRSASLCLALGLVFSAKCPAAFAASFPYTNDFDAVGLETMSDQFTLDAANSDLGYVSGGGTVVSTASEPITGIGNADFVVSTRFVLNGTEGTGTNISIGFGAFGSSNTFASTGGESFYLADWSLFGGTPGVLRVLALGDNNDFSAVNSDIGGATVGQEYELRLTGVYAGGTLDMSLAVYDAMGIQVGTTATASDTSPLTGEFFGFRNRTASANHMIDADFRNFNVVPEPSAILLLLCGGMSIAAIVRRKTRFGNRG